MQNAEQHRISSMMDTEIFYAEQDLQHDKYHQIIHVASMTSNARYDRTWNFSSQIFSVIDIGLSKLNFAANVLFYTVENVCW